jgi:hypothetical protein
LVGFVPEGIARGCGIAPEKARLTRLSRIQCLRLLPGSPVGDGAHAVLDMFRRCGPACGRCDGSAVQQVPGPACAELGGRLVPICQQRRELIGVYRQAHAI